MIRSAIGARASSRRASRRALLEGAWRGQRGTEGAARVACITQKVTSTSTSLSGANCQLPRSSPQQGVARWEHAASGIFSQDCGAGSRNGCGEGTGRRGDRIWYAQFRLIAKWCPSARRHGATAVLPSELGSVEGEAWHCNTYAHIGRVSGRCTQSLRPHRHSSLSISQPPEDSTAGRDERAQIKVQECTMLRQEGRVHFPHLLSASAHHAEGGVDMLGPMMRAAPGVSRCGSSTTASLAPRMHPVEVQRRLRMTLSRLETRESCQCPLAGRVGRGALSPGAREWRAPC